jgi:hypothetical protein
MKQTIQNIIKWFLQMGWPFIVIIYGGVKWYGKDQVDKQAVKDSMGIVLKESRQTRKDIGTFYQYMNDNSGEVNLLKGSYKALDRSYVRTLEKNLKDKDELLQYKNEQIDALKKKDSLIPYSEVISQ